MENVCQAAAGEECPAERVIERLRLSIDLELRR